MATAKDIPTQAPADSAENTVVDEAASLAVRRYFTIPGRDPFDEIEWEIRDAFIPGKEKAAFDQKSVEFPKFWSQTATNIVAQKYFRGKLGTPARETMCLTLRSRSGELMRPRKYFCATMFVAVWLQNLGNSTSRCSNDGPSLPGMSASRVSHSTASKGSVPASVK